MPAHVPLPLLPDLPICRQHPVHDGNADVMPATPSNSLNARQTCHTPATSGVTSITLAFPAFKLSAPEADYPIPYTVSATIEYPEHHFTRVTFDGAPTRTIPPGADMLAADPVAVSIPPDTRFHIRLHVAWQAGEAAFPLAVLGLNNIAGDFINIGRNQRDKTEDPAENTNGFGFPPTQIGWFCQVLGRLTDPLPILGIIGDSLAQAVGDTPDPIHGGSGYERAMRNAIPVVNLARAGDTLRHYLMRNTGRTATLRRRITHLLLALGRNDLNDLRDPQAVCRDYEAAIRPWIATGIAVIGATITPHATSADGWATPGGQKIQNRTAEAGRRLFNTWLRDNAARIGLATLLDLAHAVDPGDTGLWTTDGTPGHGAIGQARLTGTAISAITLPEFNRGTTGGHGYPANRTDLPCRIIRYVDDNLEGDDAIASAHTNEHGEVTAYTVHHGGAYTIPPMITPAGAWTTDGLHWSARGLNEAIARTRLGPDLFA